jgi:hypothetical protein
MAPMVLHLVGPVQGIVRDAPIGKRIPRVPAGGRWEVQATRHSPLCNIENTPSGALPSSPIHRTDHIV